MRQRGAAAVLWAAVSLQPQSAGAALASDVDAVRSAQEAEGAAVVALAPRVLSSGASHPVALPEEALAPAGAPCTTVTVMGAASTVFVLSLPALPAARSSTEVVPSSVGVAAVTRCDGARTDLLDLTVEMRSPHAVLETLVARSVKPAPEARRILPAREPGPLPTAASLGPGPAPTPIEVRSRSLSAVWLRELYAPVGRQQVQANARGAGQVRFELGTGCHRLAVLGIPGEGSPSFRDLDAELELESGRTITDRSESADALLALCVGEPRMATLSFVGAPPGASVLVLGGMRALPSAIPEAMDLDTGASLTHALQRHPAPFPTTAPLFTSFGVAGQTRLPMSVEPGQCYVAALAPMGGTPRLVSLALTAGGPPSVAHSGDPHDGVAVAGCARSTKATLEVEVIGGGAQWALSVWPASGVQLGVGTR